jgi:hypothetical protein
MDQAPKMSDKEPQDNSPKLPSSILPLSHPGYKKFFTLGIQISLFFQHIINRITFPGGYLISFFLNLFNDKSENISMI